MAYSDLEWINKLTKAVLIAVPAIYGDGVVLASNEPERIDRRYSFMFRYQIKLHQAGSRTILLKIPHESWMRTMDEAITSEHIREVTQREYDVMASIADVIETSNEPGLFAIRPGACFPELGALLVEEYPLRMLKTSLTRLRIILGTQKSWDEFEKHVGLAGIWLQVIHKDTSRGRTKPLKELGIQKQLDEEFSILEKILRKSLGVLREKFQRVYGPLRESEIPLASLHNDYHLGNVFVMNNGRVGVLDPNWVEAGSIYEDLSSLLIDPVTRKMQVISLGLLFRPFMYRQYEEAVFRGYFGDEKVPLPQVYFYCALDILVKWRMDEETLSGDGSIPRALISKLVSPLIRFYFRRLISQYLQWGLDAIKPADT